MIAFPSRYFTFHVLHALVVMKDLLREDNEYDQGVIAAELCSRPRVRRWSILAFFVVRLIPSKSSKQFLLALFQ